MNELIRLQTWARRGYYFELRCGGHWGPTGGVTMKLWNTQRSVTVSDTELGETTSYGEMITEALRRWDADESAKWFHVDLAFAFGEMPMPVPGFSKKRNLNTITCYVNTTTEAKALAAAAEKHPGSVSQLVTEDLYIPPSLLAGA